MSLSIKAVQYAYRDLPVSQARVKEKPRESAFVFKNREQKKIKPRKDTLLLFTGDIMLDRAVRKSVKKNASGDFSFLFQKIKPAVQKADIAFGNLEGPVSDVGSDIGNLYSFRMPPEALEAIKDAGFDALSLANNHTGDWGRVAFEDTLLRLNTAGILPVGGGYNENNAVNSKPISKNGLRFSFLGFSDVGPKWLKASKNRSGILIADGSFAKTIKKMAKKTDVLIISIHFGEEYKKFSNKRQQMLAKSAIDNGAKIVIGHHPHVTQEVEKYKDGIIAYSLGNFIFDQNFSKETMRGLMLEVVISPDGKIKSFKKRMVKMNEFFQPELQ